MKVGSMLPWEVNRVSVWDPTAAAQSSKLQYPNPGDKGTASSESRESYSEVTWETDTITNLLMSSRKSRKREVASGWESRLHTRAKKLPLNGQVKELGILCLQSEAKAHYPTSRGTLSLQMPSVHRQQLKDTPVSSMLASFNIIRAVLNRRE